MASVVLTALGSGALGLMYGVASAPKKIVQQLKSSDESLIQDCQDCLQYMQTNASTDVDPTTLSDEQKLALEKCESVRMQPVNKLEGLLRGMMKGVDRQKLSALAQQCRGKQCSTSNEEFLRHEATNDEEFLRNETTNNEEYMHYNGEWTDMSSFEYTDDQSSVASVEEMMTQDML